MAIARPPPRTRLLVEELEPRILYAADAAALLGLAGLPAPAQVRQFGPEAPPDAAPAPVSTTLAASAHEIVFVDSRVPDAMKIVDDLIKQSQQAGSARTFDIVMLQPGEDGVAQIGLILAQEQGLAAIHIISHGSDGAIEIGDSQLDAARLASDSAAVAAWGRSLAPGGDLLLYGCDVAQDALGQVFVQDLARLTGANVAASTDATGQASQGGNWNLEYASGAVHTAVALDSATQADFVGTLAYVQQMATWSPTVAGSWQNTNLNAAYGIPANAVVDVVISNSDGGSGQTGGVRAVGSVLDRSFVINKQQVGTESLEMLVQANASGQIQTYASSTSKITYTVLGYWTDGTYVETAGSFTVSSAAAWQTQNLSSIGVGANDVAEIVITNANGNSSPQVGVREVGSGLNRVVSSRSMSGGNGPGTVTMLTQTDASGAIQAYAQTTGNVTFNVVGYWSKPPGTYVETFANIGVPSVNSTWQSVNLSAYGVSGDAIANVLFTNQQTNATNSAGVRAVGTIDNRVLALNSFSSGAGGGPDSARMFVTTSNDANATIQFYDTNRTQANFYLLGYFAPNHAPTLDAAKSPVMAAELEDVGVPSGAVGTLVSSLVDFAVPTGQVDNVTDGDPGAQLGIAITAADTSHGQWFYSTDGSSWNSLGAVSDSNARLLFADATTRLYFLPDPNYNGTLAGAITLRAWDRTDGLGNGTLADTRTNGNESAYSVATEAASLTVTNVNDAPIIANGAVAALAGTNEDTVSSGTTVGAILTAASWSDVDANPAKGIAVTAVAGNGTWQYSTDGTTWTAFGAVTAANALLLDAGTQVRYLPDGLNGETATFAFKAWDQTTGTASVNGTARYANPGTGGGSTAYSSQSASASITVTPVNDAPSGLTAALFPAIAEDNFGSAGQLVSNFTGSTSDPDIGAQKGIAVIGVDNSQGQWQYTLDGSHWSAVGNVSTAAALLLPSDATTRVRFVPNANFNGTVAGFSAVAWDQSAGTAGTTANASVRGGVTPFSASSITVSITVNAVNDAPVASGSATLAAINEDAVPAGATVGALFGGNFSDATDQVAGGSSANTFAGIAIGSYTVDPARGQWQYSTDGGSNWVSLPGATTATAITLKSVDLLRFLPALNYNGAATALAANLIESGLAVTTGATVDLSGGATGGATHISAATVALIHTVNAVNDPPTASNLNAPETYVEDTPLNLTDIVIADVDSASVTATLTLSDPTAGSLNIGTSGAVTSTYIAGTGVWSASGAIADVNALLASLTFTPAANRNGNFTIATSVSDGVAAPVTGSKAVTGTPVNDEQVLATNTGMTVAENSTGNVITAAMLATTDVDNTAAQLVYTVTGAPIHGTLRRAGVALALNGSFTQADIDAGLLSYDHDGSETSADSFGFSVDDGTGTASTGTFAIAVTPVNDHNPVITSNGGGATAVVNVAENTTAVTTVTATDADLPAQTLTYSISGGADAGAFTIDGATGVLRFIAAPVFAAPTDANGDNVYEVTVQASDGALTDVQDIAVTVSAVNVNHAPVITSDGGGATATRNVAENTTAVTTVDATDVDAGTTLTYSINGGADAAKFAIDSATGVLRFIAAPNFEAPTDAGGDNVYDVVVQVSDGTLTDTQAIAVTVTDVNEAPVITSDGAGPNATRSVAENTTAVTTVSASDVDAGTTLSYSISGGADAAKFSIDAATGALRFITAPDFEAPTDAGGDNVYNVTVQVSDGTLTDAQAIAVTVTNVNEAPVITSDGGGATATRSVAENTTAVTTVTATDADAGTTLTYSISGGADAAKFAIDAATGALRFVAAPNFEAPTDAGGDNVYDVTVQVSDGTFADTQAIAVTVTDVNEAPTITSDGGGPAAARNVAENTTAVTTVTATDADAATTLSYSISGGADAARFAIDANTGALSFVTAPDFESPADAGADNVYDVIVQVSDGALTDTQAIAVTVTNVNEAPVITSDGGGATATRNVAENSTAVTTVTATDPDAGTTLTYSISGGADAARFTIDASTGALSFTTAPDFEAPADANGDNVYDVVVQVSDGALTDTQAIAVTVTNVNEAPAITSDGSGATATRNVAENSTAVTSVTATDPDAGTTLTYSISGGADAARFTIDGATGTLSFATAPDFEAPADANGDNVYDVIVQVSDGALTDTQAIAVTVTNVNEAPAITSDGGGATATRNVAENTTAVTTVTAADPDAGTTLSYSISGGADAARFAIDANTGALSFVTAPDFESPADAGADNVYDVIVQVSDGALTDTQAIAVTVTNVNEAPVITSDGGGATATRNVAENSTAVTTVTASDPDAGTTLTYSISGGADAALFTIDGSTGALSFATAPDFEVPADANGDNVYDVIVQVSDGALSDSQAIAVTVTNVNEAPTATNLGTAQTYLEDTPLALTPIVASDVDSANLTATLTLSAPAAGSLNIGTSGAVTSSYDAGTGVWTASGAKADVNALLAALTFTPAANFNGDFSIATSISDGIAPAVVGSKAITGTAVNDAPEQILDGTNFNGVYAYNDASGTWFVQAAPVDTGTIQSKPQGAQLHLGSSAGGSSSAGIILGFDGSMRLGDLIGCSVASSGSALSLNLYLDTGGDGGFFGFSGTQFTGMNGDSYATMALGANGGTINTNTVFTKAAGVAALPASFTLAQLAAGAVPGIDANTRVALWIGGGGGFATDIASVSLAASTAGHLNVQEDAGLVSLGLGGVAFGPGRGADEAGQTVSYTVTAVPNAAIGNIVLGDGSTVVSAGTVYSLAQLQGMQFKTAANANGNAGTFSFAVRDDGGTLNGGVDTITRSLTISVAAVNDAPVETLPGAQTTSPNTPIVFSGGNAITVGDVDAGSAQVQVTLGVADYQQGFDNGNAGWSMSTVEPLSFGVLNDATVVASGTNGITARSGATYAVAAQNGIGNGGSAFTPFADSRAAGYSNVFPPGGFMTSIDVYLDPSIGYANNTQFDYTVSVSDVAMGGNGLPQARRDFIFNAAFYDNTDATGSGNRFVIAASNNAGHTAGGPSAGLNPVTITSAGWYTLEHRFYDNGSGVLAVDLTVKDGAGVVLHTWTLSNPTDVIGSTVGGGRYGWFANQELPSLAFDNVTRTSAHAGTLTLATTNGLTFTQGDGTADARMTFSGTLADVNAALNGLSYQPANNYSGTASLLVVTNDQGNTGAGGSQVAFGAVPISVVASMAPTVSTTGIALAYLESAAPTAVDASITVSDVDSAMLAGATVRISGNYANGQDLLGFTDTATITGSWDAATGTLTLSGSDTVANYQAALRSVSYANSSHDPSTLVRTVSFVVSDGSASSAPASRDVNVTAVNDAPTLTATALNPTFTEAAGLGTQAAAVQVFSAAAAGTVEAGQAFTGLVFTVGGLVDGANEVVVVDGLTIGLGANSGGTTAINGLACTSTVSGGMATIVLSGGSLSAAELQNLVDAITYQNTRADDPTAGNRVFTLTQLTDDGGGAHGGSDTTVLAIASNVAVIAVDDAPVISSDGGGATALRSLAENTSVVTTVTATDVDGPALSYAIAGGADAARFAIDGTTGVLSFVTAPNFEAPADANGDNVYDVIVQVSDGTLTDTQAIAVTVTNVNEAPVISSDGGGATATRSVAENGTAVTTVTATDPDASTTLSYTIAGGADAARFSIDGTTGVLSFVTAPNFEAPADANGDNVYDVIVQVSDGTLIDTQAIAVTVTNVNEAPVISSDGGGATATRSVAENGTAVTTVTATDPDASTTLSYTIAGGADAARFSIDGTTGVLSFVTAPNFEAPADANGDNVYDVIVQVSDGSLTDSQAVAVTVTNINEAPAITSDGGGATATRNVAENTSAVTTVTAADPDAGTTLTYSISGGADAARFTIDGTTGALSFVTAPNYELPTDANGDNVYDVIVQVSDGTLTDTQAIAVTVTNVNEAPVISSDGGGATATRSVAENGTAVTTVTATDPDASTTLSYTIAGGADAARFSIDGTTGVLSFVTAPNFEAPADANGDNVYDVIVRVSDGSLTDSQAIAVTVTNINEAPAITSDGGGATATRNVAENTSAVTTVTAADPDAGTTLTYSISGGADAARFTIDGTTGALSFVTAPNFEAPADANGDNVYDVIVRVSDGALTDTQAIAVTVTNVNEAPVISSDGGGATATRNVAENTSAVTTVTAADPDAGMTLTYSISGGADAARFTIDGTTGTLSFVTAPNFEAPADANGDNVYDVIVQVSDGSLTDSQAIAVTVTNVNEAPAITSDGGGAMATRNVAENTTAVTTVAASDPDAGTTLTYSISGGADAARFAIDASTGALRFVTAPDFESPADAGGDNVYDVIVKVSDGTLTATQAIAVGVADVNEAPRLADAVATVAEGAAITLQLDANASDVDAGINGRIDPGSVQLLVAPSHGELLLRADGSALYTHDGGETSSDSFSYTVRDAAGAASNVATWRISVTPVNDPPTLNHASLVIQHDQGVVLGASQLQAGDPDNAAASLSFVVSDVRNGRFESQAAPGVAIDRFSQGDLLAGQIRFVSTSAVDAPSFSVAAFDGQAFSAKVTAAIVFGRDSAPPKVDLPGTPAAPAPAPAPAAPVRETAPQAAPTAAAAAQPAPVTRVTAVTVADRSGEPTPAALVRADVSPATPVAPARGAASAAEAAAAQRIHGEGGSLGLNAQIAAEGFQIRTVLLQALEVLPSGRPSLRAEPTGSLPPAAAAAAEDRSYALSEVQTAQATGIALTAGTVWWALRAGGLVTGLLVAMPAWRHADLLAVLPDAEEDETWDLAEDDEAERDDVAVGHVFEAAQGEPT